MPRGVYVRSEAYRDKMRLVKTGTKASKATKSKMRIAHTGKKLGDNAVESIRKRQMGNKIWLGRRHSEESKKKMSDATRGIPRPNWRGPKAYQWKGGVTPVNRTIRNSLEYRAWREAVFTRDDYTCQKYKTRGGQLRAHHLKNFSQFPELRFAIDNAITLSNKAHKEFHRKYGIKNNTPEQIQEFLCQS